MLLQSWSATPGVRDTDVVRIFRRRRRDAGRVVRRPPRRGRLPRVRQARGGETTWFRIKATRAGVLRVRDNFGGRAPAWNRPGVVKAGANYELPVKSGDVIEARVGPRPAESVEPACPREPRAIW